MELFPHATFTTGELNILAEQLVHPVVQKYLTDQARQAVLSIAEGSPAEGESDASYLRRVAAVRGSLAVFRSMLAIEPVARTDVNVNETGV